ncbi:MAG: BACON domain-containing protein [Alistipes sp.]|nr:BACON domain-containing protein [Alistipes sp.]
MKNIYKKLSFMGKWAFPVIPVGLAIILTSCIRDDVEIPVPPEGTRVTLSVQVPGGSKPAEEAGADSDSDGKGQPGTRAMPADEARIDEVYVLLFHPGGTLEGAYPGSAPQNHPSIPGRRTFTVTLPEGNFDVMVMANSLSHITVAGLTAGMTREQVSAAPTRQQTGKWNVAGSDLFPFWGELKNVVLQKSGTLGVIPLNRAVAKIDIVSPDAVKNDFTLQTVSVYHWQEYMALIPDDGNLTGNEVTNATRTGTTLDLYPASGKITYSGSDISAGGISSKIYLNETPNPGSGDFPVIPCIVIGGQLTGETGLRYYRIDLSTVEADGTRKYRDLLRNHHYSLTLRDLLTNGSDTEEEAYESTAIEIETDIQVWEEGQLKNIIIDGEYWLRVDPAEFELAREAHDATPGTRAERFSLNDYFFEIESNTEWKINRSGIVYDPADQNGWFNLNNRGVATDWSGTANTLADMEIVVTENTTGQERKATFTVEAGTIRFPVTVTQSPDPMTRIMFYHMDGTEWDRTGENFISLAGQSTEFEFIVEWYPEEWPCQVTVVPDPSYGALEYEPGYELKTETLYGGRKHYHLKFKNYSDSDVVVDKAGGGHPFLSDDIHFQVGDLVRTRFFVNQMPHLVYKPAVYRLDLPRQTLDLYTNVPFDVKEVDDPYGILTPQNLADLEGHAHHGTGIFQGMTISFPLEFAESTPAKDGKKVTVTISFPYYDMPDKVIELEAYHLHPNSYMVRPGGSLHIPIRKAYRAWQLEPMYTTLEPTDLSVELLWQDAPSVVTEIALTPQYAQDGWDSEIFVRLGSDEGNALVALKQSGEILWSWHVWSSLYDPDNGGGTYIVNTPAYRNVFMDRNLGAIRASNASHEDIKYSQGLFYQYCRKDPFPPMEDYVDNPGQENYDYLNRRMNTYDIHGNPHPRSGNSTQVWNRRQITSADPRVNVTLSIRNPTLFLTSTAPAYSWFSTDIGEWPYLWWGPIGHDYYKSEFDPCPEGWRMPDDPALNSNVFLYGNSAEWGPYTQNYGYNFQNMGYVPASGIMDFETVNASNYKGVGKWFAMWCGVADGTFIVENETPRYIVFSNMPLDFNLIEDAPPQYPSIYAASGLNVRCMRYDLSRYD